MKKITIYERTIKERTGYRKYPFKNVKQFTVFYNGQIFANHSEDVNNKHLRVPFVKVLDTRKKNDLEAFLGGLGRTEAEKLLKKHVEEMTEEGAILPNTGSKMRA